MNVRLPKIDDDIEDFRRKKSKNENHIVIVVLKTRLCTMPKA